MIGDIPMENEGIKKIAALIIAADVIHKGAQKEAAASTSPEPVEKEAAGLGSMLGGIRTGLSNLGTNVGTGAKNLAAQIARSRAGLPIAGGVAGAGVATPFALEEFGEGDVGGGIAALLAGAGAGTGAGFLGRNLATTTGALQGLAPAMKNQNYAQRIGALNKILAQAKGLV